MSEQVTTPEPLLRLAGINTFYGLIHILQDVELEVGEGELVSLLGGNASGKSTTLKTILGIVRPRTGSVVFAGEDVTVRTTSHRIARGMAIVPENRRLFGPMSVLENLEMGAYLNRERRHRAHELDREPGRHACDDVRSEGEADGEQQPARHDDRRVHGARSRGRHGRRAAQRRANR